MLSTGTLLAPLLLGAMRFELEAYEPKADEKATVIASKTRFTVLTPRLLRMEYSEAGFEDRPTLAFVNRKQPVPTFRWSNAGDGGVLTTDSLKLTYTGGPFTASSLVVEPAPGSTPTAFKKWTFGMTSSDDAGNLRGTIRTLDRTDNISLNCDGKDMHDRHCTWGVVSRSGWALVNETGVPCLDTDDWWADGAGKMLRNVDTHDLYLFAHGHDYMGALADLTAVGGRVPVLPRRNLGVWFTRWYDYDAADVREIVTDFETRALPLDILILDMNWHSKQDWTGFSWDDSLFPQPKDILSWGHSKGLWVGANLHDANGVHAYETQHAAAVAAMGLPASTGDLPFTLTNQSYLYALEDVVLKAIEDDGIDFWWIDWQQGEDKGNTGQDGRPDQKMNPTIWTAKARVTDSTRRCVLGKGCTNKRGVTFARWGGLGQHRYQHGFSGDVAGLTWSNLAYQAYFSATASNVGFGFWSHDIVGNGDDHEMYVRWLQLAAYSGILRLHDRGESAGGCMPWPGSASACSTVQPWNVPIGYYDGTAGALRTREALLPYIYTHSRIAYETGVGITRPMYYSFPEEEAAYPATVEELLGQIPSSGQYLFGDALLVAPVTTGGVCPKSSPSSATLVEATGSAGALSPAPLDYPCGLSRIDVWVPPGSWYALHSGVLLSGPTTLHSVGVHLLDTPVFAKSGSVVARRPLPRDGSSSSIGLAGQPYAEIEWSIHPPPPYCLWQGIGTVYEDDGETYDYLRGKSATTTLSYTWSADGTQLKVDIIVNASGGYALDVPRSHTLRLPSTLPPTSVLLNVQELPQQALSWSRYGGAGSASWWYDGAELATVINAPVAAAAVTLRLSVQFAPAAAGLPSGKMATDLSGLKGKIAAARRAKATLNLRRMEPGEHSGHPDPMGAPLARAAVAGDHLGYLAGHASAPQFGAALANVSSHYASATMEIKALADGATKDDDKLRALYAYDILASAA